MYNSQIKEIYHKCMSNMSYNDRVPVPVEKCQEHVIRPEASMFAVNVQTSGLSILPDRIQLEPADLGSFYLFFKLQLLLENLAGSLSIKMATELW
jgi:hypothetical protein